MAWPSAKDSAMQRNIPRAGVVRAETDMKNEDLSYIRIIKSQKNSGVLINWVSETVKH